MGADAELGVVVVAGPEPPDEQADSTATPIAVAITRQNVDIDPSKKCRLQGFSSKTGALTLGKCLPMILGGLLIFS